MAWSQQRVRTSTKARRPVTVLISVLVTGLLVGAGLVPAAATDAAPAASLRKVSRTGAWTAIKPATVLGGRTGIKLKARKGTTRKLKAVKRVPKSARSLVVQVEVTKARKAGTLAIGAPGTGDKSPATISYPRGTSSTTMLITVGAGRKVRVESSAAARVKVTAVGHLRDAGKTLAPGGTRVIAPVELADSERKIGPKLPPIARNESVSPLGVGDVPEAGVRAVWLSVQSTARSRGDLRFAGPDGNTEIIATAPLSKSWRTSLVLASLDADGKVTFDTTKTRLKKLRIAVVGWVAESSSLDTTATAKGGIVPVAVQPVKTTRAGTTPRETRHSLKVTGSSVPTRASRVQMRLSIATGKRAGVVKTATSRTAKAWAKAPAVSVGARGTHDLVLTAPVNSSGRVFLSVPKGAKITQLAVTGYIAKPVKKAKDKKKPQLTITSPKNNSKHDIADEPRITIEGAVADVDSGIKRVEVRAGKSLIGTAVVDSASGPRGAWSFETTAPPGRHTFTVTAVDWAGRKATQKRTVTVTAPRADAPVIAPEVEVLSAALERQIMSVGDDVIVFSGDDAPFAVGEIIAAGVSLRTPQGLLRRVTSIEVRDGNTVVGTRQALLTEAFYEATIESKDVPLATGSGQPQAASVGIGGELEFPTGELSLAPGITTSASVLLGLGVTMDLKITTDWDWFDTTTKVERFSIVFSGSIGAEGRVRAAAATQGRAKVSKSFPVRHFPPTTFAIGPVPIVITHSLKLGVKIEVQLEAAAEVSVSISSTRWMGMDCTDGTCAPVNESSTSTVRPSANLTVGTSIWVPAELAFSSRIYDLIGPVITLGTGPEYEVTYSITKRNWDATISHRTGLSLGLALQLGPVGWRPWRWELASIKSPLLRWSVPEPHPPDPEPDPGDDPTPPGGGDDDDDPPGGGDDDDDPPGGGDDDDEPLPIELEPGTVYGWGQSYYGQTGHGLDVAWTPAPVDVSNLGEIADLDMAGMTAYALTTDGELWGWGLGNEGQLGPVGDDPRIGTPKQIAGLPALAQVSTTGFTTFGLDELGQVWSWGSNRHGALGHGMDAGSDPINPPYLSTPAKIEGPPRIAKVIAGWDGTGFAIDESGVLWGWGDLADHVAHGPAETAPVVIDGIPPVVDVSMTPDAVLALDTSGQVWAWGSFIYGNGIGESFTSTPYRITSLSNIIGIQAGQAQFFALDSAGTVWNWGLRTAPVTSDGTPDYAYVPVPIAGVPAIAQVVSGKTPGPSFLRARDGSVYTLASSHSAVSGLAPEGEGNSLAFDRPPRVPGLTGAIDIAMGYDAVVVLQP